MKTPTHFLIHALILQTRKKIIPSLILPDRSQIALPLPLANYVRRAKNGKIYLNRGEQNGNMRVCM